MKPISLHVPEQTYEEMKSLASRRKQPVASLIREAMAEYLVRERPIGASVLDLPAHDGGELLRTWSRSELYDEMSEER